MAIITYYADSSRRGKPSEAQAESKRGRTDYMAMSPEGHCYGRGATADEAKGNAIESWGSKRGGDCGEMPEFVVKIPIFR